MIGSTFAQGAFIDEETTIIAGAWRKIMSSPFSKAVLNLANLPAYLEVNLFEISFKKDSLKYINDYILEEVYENLYSYKNIDQELYNKIVGLLHANSAVVESLERILSDYQKEVDNNYVELLKTEAKY